MWRTFIERRVAYLEGHTWHIACIYLVILLYLSISLEGALVETLVIYGGIYSIISWSFGMVKTPIRLYLLGFVLWWRGPLLISGFNYFTSWGALHLLGTLHIHSWNWLLWDSHMWIGYMHFVDHLLFLEVGY
jgi:hypothetical protein